jgi:hypothetical protein
MIRNTVKFVVIGKLPDEYKPALYEFVKSITGNPFRVFGVNKGVVSTFGLWPPGVI